MRDIQNKVEAVLFITGRAMGLEELAQFCNIGSVGIVKDALATLRKGYEGGEGSLEILEEEGKYRLNIKRQYNYLSTKLISSCEMDAPTQATLALIAYKQPALQSEIIKMRGNTAYDHIHSLKEMEFIASERSGRTRALKLAPKFFEYFDIVEDALKKKFSEIAEKQEQLVAKVMDAPAPEPVHPESPEAPKAIESPVLQVSAMSEIAERIDSEKSKINKKEKRKKRNEEAPSPAPVSEAPVEIERTPREVLLSLDADDFGK